ncbi:MAG TPA: hypothetical protein VFO74_05175, partial [Pseudolabrys sp.]|nr:hypothetical protein [Pseudolabrys sp.]
AACATRTALSIRLRPRSGAEDPGTFRPQPPDFVHEMCPIAHPHFVDFENESFPSDTRLAYT